MPFEVLNSWIGARAARGGARAQQRARGSHRAARGDGLTRGGSHPAGAAANGLVFLTGFASVSYCFYYTLQARGAGARFARSCFFVAFPRFC